MKGDPWNQVFDIHPIFDRELDSFHSEGINCLTGVPFYGNHGLVVFCSLACPLAATLQMTQEAAVNLAWVHSWDQSEWHLHARSNEGGLNSLDGTSWTGANPTGNVPASRCPSQRSMLPDFGSGPLRDNAEQTLPRFTKRDRNEQLSFSAGGEL